MELHRNSLGEDYIPQPSSSKVIHRAASPMSATSLAQSYGRSSSPMSHDPSVDKGMPTETFSFLNVIMKKHIYILVIKGTLWSLVPVMFVLFMRTLTHRHT